MKNKQLRKCVSRTVRDLFFYNLIMSVVALLIVVVSSVTVFSNVNLQALTQQAMMEKIDVGIASLAGVIAGLCFLTFRVRKRQLAGEIFHCEKTMNGRIFLQLFSFFMVCQLLSQGVALGMEGILNHWGYTLSREVETVSAVSRTIPMFVYTAFVGPVAEEFVFRGFVMRSILPYGKGLAILISAVLFGVMHGNFIQGFYAVGVGIVLGYVAVEYSIREAVLMHILNNMVFSDFLGRITSGYSESVQEAVNYGVMGIFGVIALAAIFQKRKRIKEWYQSHRPGKRECLSAFTTLWVILFLALQILGAVQGLQKI